VKGWQPVDGPVMLLVLVPEPPLEGEDESDPVTTSVHNPPGRKLAECRIRTSEVSTRVEDNGHCTIHYWRTTVKQVGSHNNPQFLIEE